LRHGNPRGGWIWKLMFLFCSHGVKPDRASVRGDLPGPSWKDRAGSREAGDRQSECLRGNENNIRCLLRIRREYGAWVLSSPKDLWC
jgi:hypothetical protein